MFGASSPIFTPTRPVGMTSEDSFISEVLTDVEKEEATTAPVNATATTPNAIIADLKIMILFFR